MWSPVRNWLPLCFLALAPALVHATLLEAHPLSPSTSRRSINNGVALKILPLGASITFGEDSSDGNGYRLALRNMLESAGNQVGYVGTIFHGTMTNNACEGFPGSTIAMVDNKTSFYHAYDFDPNVILLNVGTDDCTLPHQDPQNAPARYATFLNNIHLNAPGALVLVSSLIHNLNASKNDCVAALGKQISLLATQANATGQKVAFVDMYDVVTDQYLNKTDGTHPTDEGYKIMAKQWYGALVDAGARISTPTSKGKAVPSSQATPSSAASQLRSPFVARGLVRLWGLWG